jgi:hypothetical protein
VTGYWFRPKRFGWGVSPASWQGWVATLVAVGLSVAIAFLAKRFGTAFLALLIPVLAIYVMLCVNKTEGGMRWRWGRGD